MLHHADASLQYPVPGLGTYNSVPNLLLWPFVLGCMTLFRPNVNVCGGLSHQNKLNDGTPLDDMPYALDIDSHLYHLIKGGMIFEDIFFIYNALLIYKTYELPVY